MKLGGGRNFRVSQYIICTNLEEVPDTLLHIALAIGDLEGTELCQLPVTEGGLELVALSD